MVIERYETGVRSIDTLLGGGIPSGSVLTMVGDPGSGKMDLALRFISRGFEKEEPGLFVSFTRVPLMGSLNKLRGKSSYKALLSTDDPIFLNTTDLKGLDLVLGIIEEGAVGRLVLDRPEVLGMRGIADWFKGLEDILTKARFIGMATIVIGGTGFIDIGDYTSEGILELSSDENGIRSVSVVKWPFSEGGRVMESEVGEWTR